MKLSLRKKLILLTLSLLIFVTIVSSLISSFEIQKYFKSRLYNQLYVQINELDFLLKNTNIASYNTHHNLLSSFVKTSGTRLTLIDSVGRVVFDSNVMPDSIIYIENHLDRPEIQQALNSGTGQNSRLSATINQSMFYVAQKTDSYIDTAEGRKDVQFIRLALPLHDVNHILNQVRWKIFGAGGLAWLIIAILSYRISTKLTYPIFKMSKVAEQIKAGNLKQRFDHNSKDEIGKLASLLNETMDKVGDDLVQLRKLEKMRTEFLGNVSHELRTPIFAVQGYLETLLDYDNCDVITQKKFITKAYRQAVRLNTLLTDLIDISRIESGEMKMTFYGFNIHDWLQKLVEDLQAMVTENNIKLYYKNQDSKPLEVLGDQQRLNQVITNLVTNAIKYNKPNGTVEIGYEENKKNVTIYVKDSGKGIAEEHLSRIFERFYRVDKERSRAVGGTGLGLAIVKHIVEAHGSKIQVTSKIDKGSNFYFTLAKKL